MKPNILNLFGLGKTKFSASTASLVAVLIYFAVCNFIQEKNSVNIILFSAVLLLCIASLLKNKLYAAHDPKEIVADEFLGMYVLLLIAGTQQILWLTVLFATFRIVDILKPFPFSIIDKKYKNGFGVMADDIAIGIFLGVLFRMSEKFIL